MTRTWTTVPAAVAQTLCSLKPPIPCWRGEAASYQPNRATRSKVSTSDVTSCYSVAVLPSLHFSCVIEREFCIFIYCQISHLYLCLFNLFFLNFFVFVSCYIVIYWLFLLFLDGFYFVIHSRIDLRISLCSNEEYIKGVVIFVMKITGKNQWKLIKSILVFNQQTVMICC